MKHVFPMFTLPRNPRARLDDVSTAFRSGNAAAAAVDDDAHRAHVSASLARS
jgi:hypothetical protein